MKRVTAAIAHALEGEGPFSAAPLHRSDWADVYKLTREGKAPLAAKVCREGHGHLAQAEADMLTYLAAKCDVPFPRVVNAAPPVLVMAFIENDGERGKEGARLAGAMLARLHSHTSEKFGFAADTVFAPTSQPNPWTENWAEFFRDRRILYMADIALRAKRIPPSLFGRIEKFAATLPERLPSRGPASLVHGDFWGGNVLFHRGRCAAFLDPAIYFGHGEADLAFATLFGSLGDDFFAAYRETHPIAPGFFEERVDIYNLWPLLFHAYWFGGGYAGEADEILKKFGF